MKDEKNIAAEENQTSVKKSENRTGEKMVTVHLPRKKELGKNQQEFYSVNGKNYLIKLGVDVEVPASVAELIKNNQKAEEAAYEYESSLPTASEPKK